MKMKNVFLEGYGSESLPSLSRVNLGSDFTPRPFGAVHIGIGYASADCPDQVREFSGGNPLTSRANNVARRERASDSPRLRASLRTGGTRKIRCPAEENTYPGINPRLPNVDVGLLDIPL